MSIPTWEEAAESEFWEKLPQDLHEQAVKDYLGSKGDAIDGRVQKLIGLADILYELLEQLRNLSGGNNGHA